MSAHNFKLTNESFYVTAGEGTLETNSVLIRRVMAGYADRGVEEKKMFFLPMPGHFTEIRL